LAYQIFGTDLTKPIIGTGEHRTRNDNRSQKATDLCNAVFGGIPPMPVAAFDRATASGALLKNTSFWSVSTAERVAQVAPVNLTITSNFDAATRQVAVKVRAAYTAAVEGKQRMTLALAENKIVDAQESSDTVYFEYDHEHVLRDFMTSSEGDPVLDSIATKGAGRVYERTFVFVLNEAWKAENCTLVAFIHKAEADKKEVLQSAEVKLR
jgi:hypothetical protein